MKAVFSFWSKPYHRSLHKGCAGFPSEHYFKVAFELAVLTARDHFSSIELVTDTEGYELLVNKMGLQFDTVKLDLDACADIPANLWAFGKLKAYSIQNEPFMHLDFDLFLLKPLPKWFFEAEIMAQSIEDFSLSYFQYYSQGFDTLRTHRNIPIEMTAFGDMPLNKQIAHNAGVLGGRNWQALSDYGTKAMQLIRDNLDVIAALPDFKVSEMNIIYEQAFLTRYARHHDIQVSILVNGNPHLNVVEVEKCGLVHLLASSKNHIETCQKMEITLQKRKSAKSNVLPVAK
jgi:hypothetical protein